MPENLKSNVPGKFLNGDRPAGFASIVPAIALTSVLPVVHQKALGLRRTALN
jgi:hypothetical protein